TIDSGRSFSLQGVVTVPQKTHPDVVEQRGEPRPLVFSCCLTHTEQVAQLADPALSPGRGRLPDVLFGRLPSLYALRQRFPTVVRTLRRYYATVRLPTGVHAGLLAHGLLQPSHRLSAPQASAAVGVSRSGGVVFRCVLGFSAGAVSGGSLRPPPRRYCLPSCGTTSALRSRLFRSSIPCLHVPLSTLRWQPRGWPRMTRGQDGSLNLSCMTLPFTTPRRFIPAHSANC